MTCGIKSINPILNSCSYGFGTNKIFEENSGCLCVIKEKVT